MKITKKYLEKIIENEVRHTLKEGAAEQIKNVDLGAHDASDTAKRATGPVLMALRRQVVNNALVQLKTALGETGDPGEVARKEEVSLILDFLNIEYQDIVKALPDLKQQVARRAAGPGEEVDEPTVTGRLDV